MLNFDTCHAYIRSLAALPYFPHQEEAIGALAADVQSYATTEDQLRRHKALVFQFWKKWEGPAELRAAFCALYKPRDGRTTYSALYPEEGYPPLNPELARLGMNLAAIDSLPPSAKQIERWEAECGPALPGYSQRLLGAAVDATPSLALPAPDEGITTEAIEQSFSDTQDRLENAIASLRRAVHLVSNQAATPRTPSPKEIELDRMATEELHGGSISRDEARQAVQGLADLTGYSVELENALTLELYRFAGSFDAAVAAVGRMRRNWRYVLEAAR